jgi:hypothetical protein
VLLRARRMAECYVVDCSNSIDLTIEQSSTGLLGCWLHRRCGDDTCWLLHNTRVFECEHHRCFYDGCMRNCDLKSRFCKFHATRKGPEVPEQYMDYLEGLMLTQLGEYRRWSHEDLGPSTTSLSRDHRSALNVARECGSLAYTNYIDEVRNKHELSPHLVMSLRGHPTSVLICLTTQPEGGEDALWLQLRKTSAARKWVYIEDLEDMLQFLNPKLSFAADSGGTVPITHRGASRQERNAQVIQVNDLRSEALAAASEALSASTL